MGEHAERFTNEAGNEIKLVAWRSAKDPMSIRYILQGPRSSTTQQMTPMETERLIRQLQAALGPEQAVPSPCGIASPSYHDCQNMKEVGGGMDGERYWCAICSKGFYLDYEEMK